MNLPADLKYTESHEWIRSESDGAVTIDADDRQHVVFTLSGTAGDAEPQDPNGCGP